MSSLYSKLNKLVSFDKFENLKFETPKDFSEWMKKNIKYKEFDTLMSPHDVFEEKRGSCHDQVRFERAIFSTSFSNLTTGLLFFIEHNETESKNALTHTLLWYDFKDKIYWFENAWNGQKGIHGPFKDIDALKEEITELHSKMSSSKRYPLLTFSQRGRIENGMNLGEYVSAWIDIDESVYIINEATKNPEDEGTDFSLDNEENNDPSNDDTTVDDSDNPENDDPSDAPDNENEGSDGEGEDFSVEEDDNSENMFEGDPSSDDAPEDGDPSEEITPAEPEVAPEDKNVQPKILKISTLSKALMKNKLYGNFNDFRSYLVSVHEILDDNRILINDDDREICLTKLNDIQEAVDLYIRYKFYTNNYEVNLQTYAMFSKKIDDLLTFINSLTKHKNKDD